MCRTGDINRDQIEYVLKYGVNATSDSFEFKIADKGQEVVLSPVLYSTLDLISVYFWITHTHSEREKLITSDVCQPVRMCVRQYVLHTGVV